MNLELGQIISQMIAFLIMVWVMKKFAWKPLLKLMDDRKKRIQDEFDAIEGQKQEIEKLKSEYHEKFSDIEHQARNILQEALKDGQKIADEIQNEARKQAEIMLEKNQASLQSQVAQAKIQLKNDMVGLVISATQKIVEVNLDVEKQKQLIDSFIEEAELK